MAHFGACECSGGSSGDAARDGSGGGRDTFGFEFVVMPLVAGFDLRFRLRVRGLGERSKGKNGNDGQKCAGQTCKPGSAHRKPP
jgi:hypothetical protein